MSDDAREKSSARLLTSGSWQVSPPRRRLSALLVVTVMAALAVAVYAWRWRLMSADQIAPTTEAPKLPKSRAAIVAIGEARFSRIQPPPDEIVRLDEGTIDLEVSALPANERFRVMTGDGNVEVRGTRFAVSASKSSLTAVHVWRGRVEVHSSSGAFAILSAGDEWVRGRPAEDGLNAPKAPKPPVSTRQMIASKQASRAMPFVSPTDGPAHLKRTPPAEHAIGSALQEPGQRPSQREEQTAPMSFDRAWSLLRQGDAKAAAAAFEEVEHLARGRDIEEDALYWRAVATARTGDAITARRLFSTFVGRFPASARAGEAEAALGWLLIEAGDLVDAKRAFERASLDPSPHVRTTAQVGLERLSKLETSE